jgi:hypothetical protein
LSVQSDIRVDNTETCRTIRIDRLPKRNALDVRAAHDICEAVRGLLPGQRAVVLTGESDVFCAGGDLPSLMEVADQGAVAATEVIYREFHGIVRAIHACPVPVIAAVNGPALGAGLTGGADVVGAGTAGVPSGRSSRIETTPRVPATRSTAAPHATRVPCRLCLARRRSSTAPNGGSWAGVAESTSALRRRVRSSGSVMVWSVR